MTGRGQTLDLKAICFFAATGFFLDDDTYYIEQKVLKPAHEYMLDANGSPGSARPWFKWHYAPREISLKKTVIEFSDLFEQIIDEQVRGLPVILPLSGGLDSRTQAAALKLLKKNVHAYSYSFEGGHNESDYGRKMAETCGFQFQNWIVRNGYLWGMIDRLAEINECYSEFTHPRQMAFYDRYAALGDIFSLGHWGDVLFDDMKVPDDLPFQDQVLAIKKKIVKKGGMELGRALWIAWGLRGDFEGHLHDRLKVMLAAIDIPNSANARIRAFKSMYWAPRWTSVNLSVFEQARSITVPYYDNRMCAFICGIPEKYLAQRQIQIEYLKWRAPELARITWQEHRPFNVYTSAWDKAPWNWPYRVGSKAIRILRNSPVTQRNWELQFCGEDNALKLEHYLFEKKEFLEFIPKDLVQKFYDFFRNVDAVKYSHSISMLLTLSLFASTRRNLAR
jgi:Asparagine synthase